MINERARKQTLADWIREALDDPDKDGPCTALSLVHVTGTSGGPFYEEIHTVKVGAKAYDPQALDKMFSHKAQSYAQELPGVQSFCLFAFYNNASEPGSKHPFRVSGELDFGGLATEGPTESGKTSQNMRLTEAIVQGSYRQNSMTFDMIIRSMDVMTRQNASLINQNHEAFELVKNLMMEKAREDHEYRLKEKNRQMIAQFVSFLPPLANSLLGEEVFPQSHADSKLLDAIADNVQEDQIRKLAEAVPAKVWPMLAGRLKEALERKKAERELDRPPPSEYDKLTEKPSNGNVEKDDVNHDD